MIDYSIRILVFLTFFSSLIAWQLSLPKVSTTPNHIGWKVRWFHNLSLFGVDLIVVKLLQPTLLAVLALHLSNHPLLYIDWLAQYPVISIIIAIILLDAAIYFQHRATHRIPILWRLHQVHHSDQKIDVSSAIRFHPLEIAFSLLYKSLIIYLFAIPVEAVLLFDILLNSAAMFNHTNGNLSKPLDKVLRIFIVTPDMHRIHHSTRPREANSNYGFFLSCWDKLFNSYTPTPHNNELTIGLPLIKKSFSPSEHNPSKSEPKQTLTLLTLLIMPIADLVCATSTQKEARQKNNKNTDQ